VANRSFLLTTYKLYHHLDKVKGPAKANCLSVYMSLMKYAWKKNNYECGLRHSTIAKDTRLSRTTIHRTLTTLAKLNILKMTKGKSGKTYRINATFLVPEKTPMFKNETSMFQIETKNVSNLKTLEEQYITLYNILKSDKDKYEKIELLSTLPLADLQNNLKENPYYIKEAIALKKENEKPKVELNAGAVMKNLAKKKNPYYAMKKAYNIRNNIKPWED